MVFGKLSVRTRKGESVFLGAPEAEAESLPNSKMPLDAVYKDYSNLVGALANEKYIVVGRKGSGKSAFAEHICMHAKSDPNLFAKFVKQSESNLEEIVQIGSESGHIIGKMVLYKWIILTQLLRLFSDNKAVEGNKDYNLLKQFLYKNSGYINIKDSETKELIRSQGFEVSISYLKRFFSSKLNKTLQIRQEKAPFYKLVPHLEEVLISVLSSQEKRENGNSYVLFFDDLDVDFDARNDESVKTLISLIRVSKELNNELFAKNNLDSKIVILLRDDIGKLISTASSDTAKLFSSYAASINWYQDEYHLGDDEIILNIRAFINDRIKYAFQSENMEVDNQDPWMSLVQDPFDGQDASKSSFKYVLDHTFFRPRDLLLFFNPLSTHKYSFPLSKKDINHLIGRYCEEVMDELKNEFSSFYSQEEILMIFNAFGEIASLLKDPSIRSISYKQAITVIEANCRSASGPEILEDMYNRSLVGGMAGNGYVYFKHREPVYDVYEFNKNQDVILHSALKIYCQNKGYS